MAEHEEGVFRWLRAGLVGGACLGALDLATALRTSSGPLTSAGLAELDLLAGVLGALAIVSGLKLGDWLSLRLPGLSRPVIDGALTLLPAIPLGLQLFSGAGIQRTPLGWLGPWLFPGLVACLAGVAAWSIRRAQRSTRGRVLLSVSAAVVAALCLLFDQRVLRGVYPYLHVLSVLFAVLSLTLCARVALERVPLVAARVTACVLVVALGVAPLTALFPPDNAARAMLAEHEPYAERIMSAIAWVADLDGDGASLFFAGGDCDDLDPDIGPLQAEVPNNGIDEDCDGLDEPKRTKWDIYEDDSARRTYGGNRDAAAPIVALARTRPTVVLVVDALRADRVGRPQFPALARFARESVVFSRAMAPASSTALSVPAMVTGKFLPNAKTVSVFEQLAKADKRSGLATVDIIPKAISGEIPVPASRRYPLTRGFTSVELVPTEHGRQAWGGGVETATDHEVTERAFKLLDGPARPDVLWVHYFDLHQWAMLRDVSGEGIARYDAVLERVDHELERWLGRGDTLNLIVVSDHGEALGEHGVDYHTRFLWRELVHVPLLLRIPGVPPSRVDTSVSTTDLAPTLLDLSGVENGAAASFSLLTLVGVPKLEGTTLVAFEARHASILHGRYRLILDMKTRATWLFDQERDPSEHKNLSGELPAITSRMVKELAGWQKVSLPAH